MTNSTQPKNGSAQSAGMDTQTKLRTCDGDPAGNEVCSDHDKDFVYRVGETVEVQNFDENRWNECAPGIHHYITREEAVRH